MWRNGFLFLKVLVFGTVFISTIAIPVLTFAFVKEDPVTQQPGKPLLRPVFQGQKQDYLRGELILKFKDEAIVGAVAGELFHGQQAFQEITADANLDRLNIRYKVKAIRKVFGKATMHATATGPIDRQAAATHHRQQQDRFKAEVSSIREKRLKKKGLTGKNMPVEKNLPYLGSVYNVEVDPATDIEQACREYGNDPQVAYCQPNYRMEAQWIPNDPYYSSSNSWGQSYDDLWGLKMLQTAEAWDVTKGEGVVVAVVDTGADYNHVDLAANIWTNSGEIPGNGIDDDNNGFVDDVRGWDFVSNDNNPMDGHGHGTHVSGTIAAVGDNELGIIGVAPSARIMPLKGLSDTGSGSSSGLSAGIQYAADNGADVINNSWGCGSACPSNPVAEDAVKYAHDLGSVVVFAAGNSKNDVTLYSPGNQANSVITVASSTELDTRSYFSNIGSLIDVAAPGGGEDGTSSNRVGRNILSLRAGTTDMYADGLCTVGTNYYRSRGTSMAAPHVAGVAALVLAAHPAFTPDDVSQAIRASADDIESPGFDLLSGTGRVNAQKAVAISVVPRVRITAPLDSVDVTKTGAVTITGDAYGANFAKYQFFYATLDKVPGQVPYVPTVGAWQALGPESFQNVTDGVLATFNSTLFQLDKSYLVKLEVTTTDNAHFSDVKEILLFKGDPRHYRLATTNSSGNYYFTTASDGDRFAWIDTEASLEAGGRTRYIGKVFDGATNKLLTIYPVEDNIQSIHLMSNRIVWSENSPNFGETVIASLSPTGELVVERNLPLPLASADQDNLLHCGGSAYIGYRCTVYNVTTDSTSQDFSLPSGENRFFPSLQGNSVVTAKRSSSWSYETINLTNIATSENEVVKVLDWVQPSSETPRTYQALNGSGVVVWVENHSYEAYPLLFFDKATREIRTAAVYSHTSSFATDGKRILYSVMGSTGNELYSYDFLTGTTTLFAQKYAREDDMYPGFGTRHIQWYRGNSVMITNDVPVLSGTGDQTVALNSTVTIPVTAFDPEGDKVELAATGGAWPDTSTELPAGATFSDNGNGTGSLHWTPTTPGVYTVAFMARDFTGRKDGTWNSVQTATYLVHDPSDPLQSLGVTIAGSGTVHSSPAPDLNCSSGTCSQSYTSGTVVTLSASPDAGLAFSGWSGACSGSGVCTVTMDQARMVNATFTSISGYPLSVIVSGSGAVHSSSTPDINCTTGTCSRSYDNGTIMALIASPDTGYAFLGWSGACSGTGTCTVTMNQAQSVTAIFTMTTSYPLSVTISGSGAVRSSLVPYMNCSSGTCNQDYNSGSVVTLTASLDPGFLFSGWSGACSGTGTCSVTMDQTRSITATFTNNPVNPLSVTIVGSGVVHSSPAQDINCTAGTCNQPYNNGLKLTLTSSPNPGSAFLGWSGACSGTGSCSVTMDQSRSVTATFTNTTFMLTTTVTSGGAVHSSPAPDINCTSGTCSQPYLINTIVTLTSTPDSGYVFLGWSGVCSGIDPCTIAMNQARSVTATFTSSSNTFRTLTVSVNILGDGRGTVRTTPLPGIDCNLDGGFSQSCTQSYISGTTVTLTALPAAGSFIRLISGDCVAAGGSCSITMNQARNVQVYFATSTCVAKITDCHTSLRDAYLQATSGSSIKAAGMIMDSLDANRNVSINLEGGYDAATYAARPGVTTLPQLTITSGTVTVSDIVIQ